ncbi:cell wall protein [Bacillus coahuilensis p1.1.43]|uniref:Cell wall protein n=1 Tax=Bacillus coahuilensis p1.1.43 TaxID=1150625 RepID=A0A147K4Q2_9BACI|nr:cell wall protein [Bacillus coahuilensis]KUP04427.1 cell wall protein [Bacillus coahuilensis p1.1.43]
MRNRSLLRYLVILLPVLLMCMTGVNYAAAAPNDTIPEVDIATTPTGVLFDVSNMKPGDWADRSIKVSNKGREDFTYKMTVHLKSGSKKLYNELMVRVSDSKSELYYGKIGDFKGLDSRMLAKSEEEELSYTVEFPAQLGNDYQGLQTEIEFKFFVEGTIGGLLPVDGPRLPDTATSTFTLLAIGGLLTAAGFSLVMVNKLLRYRSELTR